MNCESRIRRTVVLLLLVGVSAGSPLHGQASPESVLMLSEDTITWWVVDSSSGLAMFYGGDIVKICSDDPEGYDLLAFQEVRQPNDVATNLVAKGEDIGASLWDHAPPFVMPRLCTDILSRSGPMATGTADLTLIGRFPTTWSDPDVVAPYGLTASGTMTTPDGETLRVNARYRCVARGAEQRCTQGVTVR